MTLYTLDGTAYRLIQEGLNGPWYLTVYEGHTLSFDTFKKALFCLGGVVQWDAWTDKSRETLAAFNDGKAI